MHGIIGSIGLLILSIGIAAGGVSLVTSYWQVRDSEHRGFWMECLRIQQRIQCVSNIEGDVAKHRYADNDWYKATVVCHAFGVVSGFLAALLTLWCICGEAKSTKTILTISMGVISCCLYICSVTMWRTQWVEGGGGWKDGWSFHLGIAAASITAISTGVSAVGVYVK